MQGISALICLRSLWFIYVKHYKDEGILLAFFHFPCDYVIYSSIHSVTIQTCKKQTCLFDLVDIMKISTHSAFTTIEISPNIFCFRHRTTKSWRKMVWSMRYYDNKLTLICISSLSPGTSGKHRPCDTRFAIKSIKFTDQVQLVLIWRKKHDWKETEECIPAHLTLIKPSFEITSKS